MSKLRLTETSAASIATPPAGTARVYYDDATTPGVLKIKKDDGSTVTIEATAGADADAIHDNQANEISAITEKAAPVGADIIIIEDSEAAYIKKKVQITNLPAGAEINDLAGDGISGIADDQLAVGTGAGTAAYQTLPNGAVAYDTTGGTFAQASSSDLSDGPFVNGDADAIHDNVSGEIAVITEKTTLVGDDLLLIEDSEATNAKKRVKVSNLPAGSLPATVVETDQSNTYTTGTQDFLAATAVHVTDSTFAVKDNTDPTKIAQLDCSAITAGNTRTLTVPDLNGTVVLTTGIQSLSNKTLDTSTTINVLDSALFIKDNTDPTKVATFSAGLLSTGITRAYVLPDDDGTLTLTNVVTGNFVGTNQSNTYISGAQDFSAATSLTVPVAAGAGPTVSGQLAYDSTAKQLEYGDDGTNRVVVNTDEAQTLTNKTINDPSNFVDADQVHYRVWNATGSPLAKGAPVYVSGYSVPNSLPTVALADCDSSSTMPAFGLVEDTIADGTAGQVLLGGVLKGTALAPLDTSGFSVAGALYVSGTAGVLTSTEPVGSALIQKVGICVRAHVTLGEIAVVGAGRTNAIPNFSAANKYWYGGTAGVKTEGTLASDMVTFLATPTSANLATTVTDETGSGALVFGTGPTINGSTLTGAHDAGGATSFELPNGAGGTTVDAAGEACIDTTSRTLNFYDGTAEVVLNPLKSAAILVMAPVDTDDLPIFKFKVASTLVQVNYAITGGTNWVGQVQEADDAQGTGAADTQAADSTVTGSTEVTSFSNASFDAGDYARLKTTSVSGSVTWLHVQIFYRENP